MLLLLTVAVLLLLAPLLLARPRFLPVIVLLSYTVFGAIPIFRIGTFLVLPYHVTVIYAAGIMLVILFSGHPTSYATVPRVLLRFVLLYGIFLGVLAVSAAAVGTFEARFLLQSYIANLAVAGIVALSVRTAGDLRLAVRVLLIVTIIGGVLGILQAVFGPKFAPAYFGYGSDWRNISRPIVGYGSQPYSYGLSMLVGVIPAATLLAGRPGRRTVDAGGRFNRLPLAAAGAGLIGLVLSGGRSSWLGVVVGMFYVLSSLRFQRFLKPFIAGTAAAIAAAVFFTFVVPVEAFVKQYEAFFAGDLLTFVVAVRLALAAGGLELLSRNPLFGIGLGEFRLEVASVLPDVVSQITTAPHAVLLGILVENGLIGLALYLAILVYAFRTARPLPGEEEDDLRLIGIGLRATLLAYSVDALFHNYFFDNHLWYLVGLMLAVGTLQVKRRHSVPSSRPS